MMSRRHDDARAARTPVVSTATDRWEMRGKRGERGAAADVDNCGVSDRVAINGGHAMA